MSASGDRRPAWPVVSAWALWLLTVLTLAAAPLLDRLLRQAGRADLVQLTPGTAFPVVAMVSGATVGAVLASRRPRHPVGWLLLTVALSLTATAAAAQYLTWGLLVRPGALPGARWVALYLSAIGFTAITSIGLLLLVVLAGAVVLAGLAVGVASAYGLLTLLLAGGYALVALGLGRLLGQDSSLVVAAATLAVAAVFQPARRRVQAAVDRRFNRRRHDAGRVIEAFRARLRDQVDLDTLTAEVIAVADHTMQPTSASLWLRPGQAGSGPARPRRSSG